MYLQVGGHWLSWWMVAAAAVSQIGQFEAEMSSDSFQLLGMAERGFLPKGLARRSKHDTPTVSSGLCCCHPTHVAPRKSLDKYRQPVLHR